MERHGWRFIFNQEGTIIFSEGRAEGDLAPRKDWSNLGYAEFEYDELDLEHYDIKGIDPETSKPILVKRPITETEEQRRIRELEDALLLAADAESGGIL